MTAVGWLAFGLAVLLEPGPAGRADRLRALATRGRLMSGRTLAPRPALGPSPTGLAAGGCALVAGFGWVVGGPVIALSGALAGGVIARVGLAARRRRAATRCEQQLLAAIRILVAELAAGSRPAAALAAAAGASPDDGSAAAFGTAARAAAEGGDAEPALRCHPALLPLAGAWRVATASGAPLAGVLGRVADDLAGRTAQARAVAAALAGPRSSAAVVAGLPVLGIGLGAAMGADPLTFLVGAPAGRLVALVGVALDAAGVLWTQRLVDRAAR